MTGGCGRLYKSDGFLENYSKKVPRNMQAGPPSGGSKPSGPSLYGPPVVYEGPRDPRRSDMYRPGIATLPFSKDPFPGTLLSFLSDFLFGVLRNFLGSSCSGPRSCALAGCADVVSTMPDALAGCDDVVSTMPDALMDGQVCFITIVWMRSVSIHCGCPWYLHLEQRLGPRRKLWSTWTVFARCSEERSPLEDVQASPF